MIFLVGSGIALNCYGIKLRLLYAQRQGLLSQVLPLGNSPADFAVTPGNFTKIMLEIYAKPTGRLMMTSWQAS